VGWLDDLNSEVRLMWAEKKPALASETRDRLTKAGGVAMVVGMAAMAAAKKVEGWGAK